MKKGTEEFPGTNGGKMTDAEPGKRFGFEPAPPPMPVGEERREEHLYKEDVEK